MFSIAWQYLTGRAVATDPVDRMRPEWPPHPDRVFQALVAAWGEHGCDPDQAAALDWLCDQPAPAVAVPLDLPEGNVVRVFVPPNDLEAPARGAYSETHLQLLPEHRKRKQRQFPSVRVGLASCALVWPDADASSHRIALAEVCAQVTHIGHSSSLVRMWVTDGPPPAVLRASDLRGDYMLRVPGAGRLRTLVDAYAGGGEAWRRPPTARWQRYEVISTPAETVRGAFDERLLMLRFVGGTPLSLRQGPAAVAAARGLLIAATDALPRAKRLISGHESDGAPLAETHVALLPLAFVGDPASRGGDRFGDGHLMGLGVALPRGLDATTEHELLLGIAGAFREQAGVRRELHFGSAGSAELAFDVLDAPPRALRSPTWCAPSCLWGTVTPIALDRSPPRRHEDADAWVAQQMALACMRQGLPEPASIELPRAAPFVGSPSVAQFPPLLRKDGTRRMHVHARLHFAQPVGGPLILGAGRYRGYGLCRPLSNPRC